MFWRMLYVLSSHISPDGMSMLTTRAGDWLMYFTMAANPPASGLLSPLPNSPSTTSVSAPNSGGSKLSVTSVNFFNPFISVSRCLLAAQSSDKWLCTLKRYTLTSYPSSTNRRATASASPPLLPGPANTTTGVRGE